MTDLYHLSDLQQGYNLHRSKDVNKDTLQIIFDLSPSEMKILENGYMDFTRQQKLNNLH